MARIKKPQFNILVRPDGKIPAAAYLRVSSNGQDVENSIDAQLERIRKWAEEHGYVIVKVFTDRARTGKFANRPDFREMIEVGESSDCPFAVVLVWRFSRFFRDRIESGLYKNRLRKRNIRVLSINEPTDDSPQGQLHEGMIELFDQYTSDVISEDVRRGTHRLAERGFFVGAIPPDRNEEDKGPRHTGPESNRALQAGPGGAGLDDPARLRPGPSGQDGQPDTSHPAKRGNPRAQREALAAQQDPRRPDQPALRRNHHAGETAGRRLGNGMRGRPRGHSHARGVRRSPETPAGESAGSHSPRHAGSGHMLSELGRCRQCGAPYVYRPAGGKEEQYEYIICKTRKELGPKECDSPNLPAPAFEAMTLDVVEEDILLRRNLEAAIDQLRQSAGALHSDRSEHVSRLSESVAELGRRIEKVYLAWENEDIPYEFFRTRSEELRELKGRAEAELAKAREELDDTHVILDGPEEVLNYSAELKTFLRDKNPARTRSWLKTFLIRYWVEPEYVTYEYRLPLPPGGPNAGLRKRRVPLEGEFRPITRFSPHTRG